MNKKLQISIATIGTAAVLFAGAALPAFALAIAGSATASVGIQTTGSIKANANLSATINNIVTRGDQEITRRITALNALSVRVNAMQKLSSSEKSTLSTNIQTQLSAMSTLQAQISADASANNTSSLKTDVQSITKSYRIFALIIPQGAIEAAADRVLTTQAIMVDLGTKFTTRVSAAQSAGNNVSAAESALTDFNAKVSDSSVQAQAAATEVASLMPDNGDATVMASNTAALKDARAKILAGQQDLVAARADAQTIIKQLATFKVSATVTASSSAAAQ